jgi:hypothetical protein
VGDFIDKPVADGGLAWSRPLASAVIAALIAVLLVIIPQRPGRHPGQPKGDAPEADPAGGAEHSDRDAR